MKENTARWIYYDETYFECCQKDDMIKLLEVYLKRSTLIKEIVHLRLYPRRRAK